MRQVVVSESAGYRLTSFGNGLAYTLEEKESGSDVFVQGDDATQFREEWEALESAFPDREMESILGSLFYAYTTH